MQTCFFPADGRKFFFQWDMNREMIVVDASIKELHYCNGTSDCSLVCRIENGRACVPNILLQTAGNLRVYGYMGDHTKIEKIFKVSPRTRPEDYVYTETDVLRYETLKAEVEELRANVHGEIKTAVNEYLKENPPSGGVQFETDETLLLENGILSVNTADVVEKDNTLPVTSAAVQTTVGNINALLETI